MSDHVIYLDLFELQDGKVEDFKEYASEMAKFVQENEPDIISFNYFINDDETEGSAVFIFPDADSLDHHLDVAGHRFQEGEDLISANRIELLGKASDRAAGMLSSFGGKLKTKVAGFGR